MFFEVGAVLCCAVLCCAVLCATGAGGLPGSGAHWGRPWAADPSAARDLIASLVSREATPILRQKGLER